MEDARAKYEQTHQNELDFLIEGLDWQIQEVPTTYTHDGFPVPQRPPRDITDDYDGTPLQWVPYVHFGP